MLTAKHDTNSEDGEEPCCGCSSYAVLWRKPEMSSTSRLSFMNLATTVSHLVVVVTHKSQFL